jgi:hypothetical protein
VYSLAVGKPDIGVKQNLYTIFIVLPVSVVLIKMFGLKGAGFSWVFYQVFSYLYSVPRVCRECLHIPVTVWYIHIAKVFMLIAVTYGIVWYFAGIKGDSSIMAVFSAYVLASVVFLVGSYFMVGQGLRDLVVRHFGKLKGLAAKFAVIG